MNGTADEADGANESKDPDGTYPVAPPDPVHVEERGNLYKVDPDEFLEPEPVDRERYQFSIAELLLLMALAALILGILGCFPRKYAAGLAGLGALASMLVLVVIKPTRAIIYLAWWLVLGIYLVTCIGAAILGE